MFLRITGKIFENGVYPSQLQSDVEQFRHGLQVVSLSALLVEQKEHMNERKNRLLRGKRNAHVMTHLSLLTDP